MQPIKIIDFCEFWSPSGGGVRRYYLEKLKYYKEHNLVNIDYTFIMTHNEDCIDTINPNLRIEKIKSWSTFGKGEYRIFFNFKKTISILKKYKPDVIEIGSPYLAPWLFRIACILAKINPKFVGFWHADFPITYAKRYSARWGKTVSNFCEKLAWSYARLTYRKMGTIFVSSKIIERRMHRNLLKNTYFLPLGVDQIKFHPISTTLNKNKLKSELLSPFAVQRSETKLNLTNLKKRKIIFFPHRLSNEKGVSLLLKAYKILDHQTHTPPLLLFTSIGPKKSEVIDFTKKYNTIFYIGYITNTNEMAKWYQISDITVALSSWETFGLSILEAMSSGVPVIGVKKGAALEHIQNSNGGISISKNNPTNLAQTILKTLDSDALKTYSKKSREYAENLTWESCFKKQIQEYTHQNKLR